MKIRYRKVRALNPAFDPGELDCSCRNSNPSHGRQSVKYIHDCEACIFLGAWQHPTDGRNFDLYHCPGSFGGTLIARFGSEGSQYASFDAVIAAIPPDSTLTLTPTRAAIREAYARAVERGLVSVSKAKEEVNPWGTKMPKMPQGDWKRLEAQNALGRVASTLSGYDGRIEVTAQHARAALNHLDEIEKKLGRTKASIQRKQIKSYRDAAQKIIEGIGKSKNTSGRRQSIKLNASEAQPAAGHRVSNLARRLANGGGQ